MDSRLDLVAKAVARGATRRQALRLAGGGLAGALLAAVGVTGRAGAQDGVTCDELGARCTERGEATCGPEPTNTNFKHLWFDCLSQEVPVCHSFFQICPNGCEYMEGCGQVGCPGDQVCQSVLNSGNQILCRCL